jgi:small subunit ribosomal protein S20
VHPRTEGPQPASEWATRAGLCHHRLRPAGPQRGPRLALTFMRVISRLPAPREGGDRFNGDPVVANTKSAEKAARQAEKHRARNVALRSRMRTAVRNVTAAIAGGNKDAAATSYKDAVPVIDNLVNKQIIHRNKAGRHKSRLAARIRAMQ